MKTKETEDNMTYGNELHTKLSFKGNRQSGG
jgi:hypothetical protein